MVGHMPAWAVTWKRTENGDLNESPTASFPEILNGIMPQIYKHNDPQPHTLAQGSLKITNPHVVELKG